MSKIHSRRCEGDPCKLEHEYLCPCCGAPYVVSDATQWLHPYSYKLLPSLFHPACSYTCLTQYNQLTDQPDDMAVAAEFLVRNDGSEEELALATAVNSANSTFDDEVN